MSRSDSAASATKSLPRWLISITDARAPSHSRSSARAWLSTSSGSAAGPALKLYPRLTRASTGMERHYAAAQHVRNMTRQQAIARLCAAEKNPDEAERDQSRGADEPPDRAARIGRHGHRVADFGFGVDRLRFHSDFAAKRHAWCLDQEMIAPEC